MTHGIAFLPQVDQIIVLQDGRISEVCVVLASIDLSYQLHEREVFTFWIFFVLNGNVSRSASQYLLMISLNALFV